MPTYASKTTVTAEKSRMEIERTLVRYGATKFMYGWEGDAAIIGFVIDRLTVKFQLPLPDPQAEEFMYTRDMIRRRSASAQEEAFNQAVRQRWRALALCIKAKLEAVEAGIVTLEDEFLAHIAIPGGKTVGDMMRPQLKMLRDEGKLPNLMITEG